MRKLSQRLRQMAHKIIKNANDDYDKFTIPLDEKGELIEESDDWKKFSQYMETNDVETSQGERPTRGYPGHPGSPPRIDYAPACEVTFDFSKCPHIKNMMDHIESLNMWEGGFEDSRVYLTFKKLKEDPIRKTLTVNAEFELKESYPDDY